MEWATTVIPLESLKMIVNFFLTYDLDSYPAYVIGSGKRYIVAYIFKNRVIGITV